MYDSSSERRSIRSRALRACRTGRTSPRLLGLRQYLQSLAASRPDAYKRVVTVTREQKADDHAKMISIALVCAIETIGSSEGTLYGWR